MPMWLFKYPQFRLVVVPVVIPVKATILRVYSDPSRRHPLLPSHLTLQDLLYGVDFTLAGAATYLAWVAERVIRGGDQTDVLASAAIALPGFAFAVAFLAMWMRTEGWVSYTRGGRTIWKPHLLKGVIIPDALGLLALSWSVLLMGS
jgi:hypothetical protein